MFGPKEDEDLDQWIANQAAQESAVPAVPVPVTPVPQASGADTDELASLLRSELSRLKAGPSDEQRSMTDRWRKAETQSLDRLTGDQSTENWAVGLGTAVPMLAGILADSLSPNAYGVRGTGLGKIAEAGVQNAQALMQQSAQRKQQAQGLAEAAANIRRGAQNEGFDKISALASRLSEIKRIENQDRALGLRGFDQVLKTDAQAFRLDPNNPQALKTRELIYTKAPELRGTLDGLGLDAMAKNGKVIELGLVDAHFPTEYQQQTQLAAGRSAASTGAQIQTESRLAPVAADTRQQLAAAGAVGSRQGESAGRPAPVGYEVADQDAFENANQDQASRTRMQTTAGAGLALKTLSSSIRDMRKEFGTNVLPSAAKSQVETYKNLVIGQLNNLANAGVLNPGERQNWDKILPGLGSSGLDVISYIQGKDLSLEQLEGVVRAADGLVDVSAAPYGLRYVGMPRAAPKPSAPSAAGASKWSSQKQPSVTAPASGVTSKWAKNKL